MTWLARAWNPWREIGEFQDEVNRLFGGTAPTRPLRHMESAAFNIWQNENGVALTAELPGFAAEDFDISVSGRKVMISGKRKPEMSEEGDRWYRRERHLESFSRTLELPFDVDAQSADASYEKGVLTIKLVRPEEQKPRKIAVKVN